MKKMLSVFAGAALLAGLGVAQAQQPMPLGASELDSVTAAGCHFGCGYYRPNISIANAGAGADAHGGYTMALTGTATVADSVRGYAGSRSSSSSVAAGCPSRCGYWY